MSTAAIDRLVWLLIYGGILAAMVGLWSLGVAAAVGGVLVAAGGAAVAAGIALIWWRSRRPSDPSPSNEP